MTWLTLVEGKHLIHIKDGPSIMIYQAWDDRYERCPDGNRTWVQLCECDVGEGYEYVINKCVKAVRYDIDEVFTDKQQAIDATKALAGLIGAKYLTKGKQYEY